MVEGCVGPSELHLKKEITALQKARFLRDPETCSSWRSPVSSKALAADPAILHSSCTNGSIAQNENEVLLPSPVRCEKRRNKVYLYNWRHHSNKSSESGIKLDESRIKLDEDDQQACDGSNSECQSNSHVAEVKSDMYGEVPVNIFSIAGSNSDTPVKRARRSRKRTVPRKEGLKCSIVPKMLELPPGSLGFANSGNHTEDSENGYSENQERPHKLGCASRSVSPLFSASGCAANILKMTKDAMSSHSCTPVSTSSYYRHGRRNPSTIGSWDGTVPSVDGAELDEPELLRRKRDGIPGYWSRSRNRGSARCYSPSFPDTLRRKGTSLLCGSQTGRRKKRSTSSTRRKLGQKSLQGLPLLNNSCDGADSSVDSGSDELSTNFEELDLEALSRLDGRRWSSCISQDGMELAVSGQMDLEGPEQRCLSRKYRPRSFDEIIGQNIVVQSLNNAILRERIAPAYLFQGARGTGKTTTARVFSAALNCLSSDDNKPCGICKECTEVAVGSGMNLIEVDGTNKKSISKIRCLLKNALPNANYSPYKVLVVDECHMISTKMWSALMKFLDEPLPRVVFIFITIDPDNLPRAVISRCQKFVFSKIKDVDIICRLRRISVKENLDVELDALDVIAVNSDGSLRDAETMLDQLSLLGKKITVSLVNDLVGVVSEEKLLDLLEIALSSDTAETVKRSRELINSGVDPMALMSQLAGLIMDIIAGTYRLSDSTCTGSAIGGRSLTEVELERLQQALKILSDAEKQIKFSSERSAWFTAALLQLGSNYNSEHSRGSSSKISSRAMGTSFNLLDPKQRWVPRTASTRSSPQGLPSSSAMKLVESTDHSSKNLECRSAERAFADSARISNSSGKRVESASAQNLDHIWQRCIEQCHSKTLRQLLCDHGKLVSVQESEGSLIAYIALADSNVKMRAERFLSSITNSLELVLRCNVAVRMGLVSEFPAAGLKLALESQTKSHIRSSEFEKERKVKSDMLSCSSQRERSKGASILSRSPHQQEGIIDEGSVKVLKRRVIPSADEQRLESAWLQTTEKLPGLVTPIKPERSRALPHDAAGRSHGKSTAAFAAPAAHWEDELTHELRALKIGSKQGEPKDAAAAAVCANGHAISPSLLHSNNYLVNSEKETPGHESGPGCNGLLCWKAGRSTEAKRKRGGMLLFGSCGGRPRSGSSRPKN